MTFIHPSEKTRSMLAFQIRQAKYSSYKEFQLDWTKLDEIKEWNERGGIIDKEDSSFLISCLMQYSDVASSYNMTDTLVQNTMKMVDHVMLEIKSRNEAV